jgi:L-ribulose-5-phosphate 3-epimerase
MARPRGSGFDARRIELPKPSGENVLRLPVARRLGPLSWSTHSGTPDRPGKHLMDRRTFVTTTGAAVVAAGIPFARAERTHPGTARFRTGLVAYSYRDALKAKTMTYDDLIRIAVDTGTDGIDMTVYWLPSTSDDDLLRLRRLAYRNRVEIYSIGTRVQLAQPTSDLREEQLRELRKWLDVAQKVGATHVRVFGGDAPAGATLDQAIGFAAETLKRGAEEAGARGLILGVEDDGGITSFAKDTIEIVKRANSPSAGMNLDIGNFRPPAVYDQIEMSIPYAVSTHVKTTMTLDDGKTEAPLDWDRVFTMFAAQGFRGYMGLEYEASGDPAVEVPSALRRLTTLARKYSG